VLNSLSGCNKFVILLLLSYYLWEGQEERIEQNNEELMEKLHCSVETSAIQPQSFGFLETF